MAIKKNELEVTLNPTMIVDKDKPESHGRGKNKTVIPVKIRQLVLENKKDGKIKVTIEMPKNKHFAKDWEMRDVYGKGEIHVTISYPDIKQTRITDPLPQEEPIEDVEDTEDEPDE